MNANEKLAMAHVSKVMGHTHIATTEGYYQSCTHVQDGDGHSDEITTAGYSHAEPNHHQSTETGEIHHE
jgi:hypothetical protein